MSHPGCQNLTSELVCLDRVDGSVRFSWMVKGWLFREGLPGPILVFAFKTNPSTSIRVESSSHLSHTCSETCSWQDFSAGLCYGSVGVAGLLLLAFAR